jgi:hypothetical protein
LELDKIKETGLHMPDYKKHLLAEVSRAQRDWKDRDTEKGLARLKSRVSDHIPENVTSFAVIDFINSRLLAIHALCLSPVGTDEMVHNMRKLIKDILYVLKAITKEAPHLLTGVVHVPEERLDYFSNILGDYNDARIMLDNMLRYSSGCPGAAERQTIEQLHSENAPKLQNERAWIVSELLNFTGKFAIAEARTGNGPRR